MAFQIIREDITRVKADAIVNTANPDPVYGSGTDSVIYKAAGERRLLRYRKQIGSIAVGGAAATPAGKLSARYIIHTVGPVWVDGEHGEKEAVAKCYNASLTLAKELKCESVAFPLIASGFYGFPKAEALKIAVEAIRSFLEENEMKVLLVVFDQESFVLSGEHFRGVQEYVDKNYVEDRLQEEYPRGRKLFSGRMRGKAGAARCEEMRMPEASQNFLGASIREEEVCEEAAEDTAEDTSAAMAGMFSAPRMQPVPMAAAQKKQRSLSDVMKELSETWQERLFRLIDERGFTDTEVYKRANVDRKLFSKIRSNKDYQPKKITAVAFALSLRLNADETRDFLGRAGYAFSPSSKFDLIVEYFIEQEVYDTYTINLALFEHEQPLLGE